jgi:hypothetical protein
MPSKRKLFTIGHSTHPLEEFMWLLDIPTEASAM